MTTLARIYHGAQSAGGPLVFLRRTPGAAQGEWVVIRTPGEPPRRGQVIDAGEEVTVVQVLEGTAGLLV